MCLHTWVFARTRLSSTIFVICTMVCEHFVVQKETFPVAHQRLCDPGGPTYAAGSHSAKKKK